MNYRSNGGMPDNRAHGFEKYRSEAADDTLEVDWEKKEYGDWSFGEALR